MLFERHLCFALHFHMLLYELPLLMMGVHAVKRASWSKSMYLNLDECAIHFSF